MGPVLYKILYWRLHLEIQSITLLQDILTEKVFLLYTFNSKSKFRNLQQIKPKFEKWHCVQDSNLGHISRSVAPSPLPHRYIPATNTVSKKIYDEERIFAILQLLRSSLLVVKSTGWHVALLMGRCLSVLLRRYLHLCPVHSEDTQQLSRVGASRLHLQWGWDRGDGRSGEECLRDTWYLLLLIEFENRKLSTLDIESA